jgi:tRNA U34 5-carboxymethylaminomethyl modifying GTPase MnmE/TrmE
LPTTAGLRASENELERAGIERTQKSLQLADLRLHIADRKRRSRRISTEPTSDSNEIVILNKSDLPEDNDWKDFPALRSFVRTGDGAAATEKGNSGTHSPAKI